MDLSERLISQADVFRANVRQAGSSHLQRIRSKYGIHSCPDNQNQDQERGKGREESSSQSLFLRLFTMSYADEQEALLMSL